jgi:hypothetical protein
MRRSYSPFLSVELQLLRQYFYEVGFNLHAYAYTECLSVATGFIVNICTCTCTWPTLNACVLSRCYADTMPRQLPIMLGGDPASMTIAECAQRCKDRYLTVFAVQYGGECFGCKSQRRWVLSFLCICSQEN